MKRNTNKNMKGNLFQILLFVLQALILGFTTPSFAFVDSWKVLKNVEDMIDVIDTAQEVGETLEEETPSIDQSKSDIISMRRDLRELGYTAAEIEDAMATFELGQEVNTESIRKLNRRIKRIKNMNLRIATSMGLIGTPDGITARNSIESNITLQNIHQELVQDRVLREKRESAAKKLELQAKLKEEKDLKDELTKALEDSKRTLGFSFSPFKFAKGKESGFEL